MGRDEKERKAAKRQAKEEERIARVQSLEGAGIPLSRLEAMLESLAEKLEERPCDHTHRHLEAVLRAEGIDVEVGREALIAEGAGCDCEAVMNIDVDELRAPPPEPPAPAEPAAPPGQPPKKQPKPQVDRWAHGRFSLSIPKSPWKLEEAGDTLVMRFGAKNTYDSLRLRIWGAAAKDEKQVCMDRWTDHKLSVVKLGRSDEPPEQLEREARAQWKQYAWTLTGPTPSTRGGLTAREYVARAPDRTDVYFWLFFDGPDAIALELAPSAQSRATGDRKELERVLETLTAG
jgi:hypothetical protein